MTRIVKQLIILFKNKNFLALKNTNNRVDKMLIIINPDPLKLFVFCMKAWVMGSGARNVSEKNDLPNQEESCFF